MNRIIEMYEKEIEDNLVYMGQLDPESDKYSKVEKVTLEMTKLLIDEKIKEKSLKDSNIKYESERKATDKSKYIDYGFKAAGILIPSILFVWSTSIGYKLEEEGSITSKTMQRCLGFIKLFK